MPIAAHIVERYRVYLSDNRRRSVHSVRAYVATAERISAFLAVHWGHEPDETALTALSATDIRAFLAQRRGQGIGNRSTARELSAIRSYLRFVLGDDAPIPAMKGPRVPRSLPRRILLSTK